MIEIPLSAPDIGDAEIEAVTQVLRSGRLSLGPKLEEFEAAMAAYMGVPRAVAVSSGTAGLHLALLAFGIGPGQEVIVPSFTFIAVANAVRYTGAQPAFADIDPQSLNLDPACVEAAITPRTRAIIAVHTFGRPADMDSMLALARRNNLVVIEDACEAVGAEIGGRKAGSFGDAAVFAFYPNKQITTGEGGMVVTRDAGAANRMRGLRNHGRYSSNVEAEELGYNYRLSEMQCALGVAQLSRIESILARRDAIARRYCEQLRGVRNIEVPAVDVPGQRLSWFVFVVRLTEGDRDQAMSRLAAESIATGRYFAPIHQQPAYAAWRNAAQLPVTEQVGAHTLALPFFNRIEEAQIERVADALRRAVG